MVAHIYFFINYVMSQWHNNIYTSLHFYGFFYLADLTYDVFMYACDDAMMLAMMTVWLYMTK